MLSRDVLFDKLITLKSEATDGVKKDIVATEIFIIKKVASRKNQHEEQQASEEVHVEPTSLAQS